MISPESTPTNKGIDSAISQLLYDKKKKTVTTWHVQTRLQMYNQGEDLAHERRWAFHPQTIRFQEHEANTKWASIANSEM